MKNILILFTLCFIFNTSAQFFQTGITLGGNTTLAIKGRSVYNNKYFKPNLAVGFNIAIPLHFQINNIWKIKSGIDYQRKGYNIQFAKPDFPNLNSQGGFSFFTKFNVVQIPLILSYKKPKQNFEFDLGILLTKNTPDVLGSKVNWTPWYSGNDTLYYNFKTIHNNNFTPYNSVDVHFGIEYGKIKNGIKKHSLKLSIEFNNFTSNQYFIEVNLENSTVNQKYQATISPKMSSLKLTYTNFIEWNFKN